MQTVINALVWAFLHSLWQGMVAALLAAVIVSFTRKTTARLRYNLLAAVLLLFLTGFAYTLLQQLENPVTGVAVGAVNSVSPGGDFAAGSPADGLAVITLWINQHASWLLYGWMFFFLLHCTLLVSGYFAVQRLRMHHVQAVPSDWVVKIKALCAVLGIRRPIRLLQSGQVKVPLALGFFKPVILLPLGLLSQLPPQQVESILLHELAHVRRNDYLANFLQHLAEAIFFFNPGMRWVSSLLRQEREACCDDIVLAGNPAKKNYLDALVAFQEFSLQGHSLAMGVTGRKKFLLNRVKRIVTERNNGMTKGETFLLLGGLVLFSAFFRFNRDAEMMRAQKLMEVMAHRQSNLPAANQLPVYRLRSRAMDTIPRKREERLDKERIMPVEIREERLRESKVPEEIGVIREKIGRQRNATTERKENWKGPEGDDNKKVMEKIDADGNQVEKTREQLVEKRIVLGKIREEDIKERLRQKDTECPEDKPTENKTELNRKLMEKMDRVYFEKPLSSPLEKKEYPRYPKESIQPAEKKEFRPHEVKVIPHGAVERMPRQVSERGVREQKKNAAVGQALEEKPRIKKIEEVPVKTVPPSPPPIETKPSAPARLLL